MRHGAQDGDGVQHGIIHRSGPGRKKSLGFGKVGTDEQEDTALSIYYEAVLSSSRKALAFVIYEDSHLGSISLFHCIAPTWKCIPRLICKEAGYGRGCIDADTPLLFFRVGARDTQLFRSCGEAAQNLRNAPTNLSAIAHFPLMLIFPVGDLVLISVRLL